MNIGALMQVSHTKQMIDITAPETEVELRYRNGVLWVNVDGICRLRVCRIKEEILVTDIVREDDDRTL